MTEVYDQEYASLRAIATTVMNALNERDKKLAKKWMDKLDSYQSNSADVARSRNDLMLSLITILRKTLMFRISSTKKGSQLNPKEKDQLAREVMQFGEPGAPTPIISSIYKIDKEQSTSFMSLWSPDKKTYIGVKPIGGEGALIYIAVTPHPELGWDLPETSQFGHSTICD